MKTHSLIIGGSRGLGRVIANEFLGRGDKVSIIGRRPPAEDLSSNGRLCHAEADATVPAELDAAIGRLFEEGEKLNNLVFVQRYKGEGDNWVGEMETSLSVTKKIIESMIPRFGAEGSKAIVLVTSIADTHVSASQPVGYHVAKAGMLQMARYYAVALGPKGVCVNCVAPSTFIKPESRSYYGAQDALRDLFGKTIPLGRMGDAQDIANLVAFFCSPQASFITGQHITVDGGVSLLSQEALARSLTGL